MSVKPKARNIMSGTHATVWWDGDICYEVSKIDIKLKANRETVTFAGDMMEDSKLMSVSGTFSITVRKVYSRAAAYADDYKTGKDPRVTIRARLADPDRADADNNTGEEVEITGAWFDELPIFSAENGKIVEEEYSGGFSDIQFLGRVGVE